MWQTLPRHILEEPAVTVGTGSLLKRLRWLSKRAWRGFQVRQITGVLRRDRNAYWTALAEVTERAAACGDTMKLYQMLKCQPQACRSG